MSPRGQTPRSKKADRALLLTPGAGADRDQPSLVAIDEALALDRVPVERMDFPYRQAGRRAPDRPAVLVQAVVDEAAALARRTGLGAERVAIGGRSMGGRMCSMAVAAGLPCLGLVLISYPLHPPGKPERLRIEHLPDVRVPCLFVSGTKDAFGTPAELDAAIAVIPGPVDRLFIDGGDHGLRGRDVEVASAVRAWVRGR